MSLLSCNCLNIQVPTERDCLPDPISPEQLLSERDYNTLHSLVSDKENHIFSSKLIHLNVNPDKSRIRVDSLAGIQKLGNWVIVRCLNCHTDCYMFDKSFHSSLYAVNRLTCNPDVINGLSASTDLSPAFGIVIRAHPQSHRTSDSDVSQVLRQKVSEFIVQTKHESEARIKEFNEKEARRISALERRAWSDFNRVISNIENESTEVSLATPLSLSPPHSSAGTHFAPNSPKYDSPNHLPILSDNDDLPFELEGFISGGNDHSDLIPESSEDEDEDSDSRSETSSVDNIPHMSRSMPINIANSPVHGRANDMKVEHIDLNDIHRSMKILAQSVTDPHYRDLPLPGHYQRSANHI